MNGYFKIKSEKSFIPSMGVLERDGGKQTLIN
jgi:hypothetical protein